MRVLAACLLGCLGLGALGALVACSDSTDMGSAGAAGASGAPSAGAGGNAPTAGGSSTAGTAGTVGTAGAGGSGECGFKTAECSDCLGMKCSTQVAACQSDGACLPAYFELPDCICAPGADPVACQHTFATEGGETAVKLNECYTLNCESICH